MTGAENPVDLEVARERLLARKAELLADSDSGAESRAAVTLDQQSVGRVSRVDALQAQAIAKAAERNRDRELAQIEAALTRIGDGDYGYCVTCGEDIAARRLAHNPAAPTCIDCAG